MPRLQKSIVNTLTSGSGASLLSLLMLALSGRRETPTAAAPINAISHWFHGDSAYGVDRASMKHTGVGLLVHYLSSLVWGALLEVILSALGRRRGRANPTPAAAAIDDTARSGTVGVGPLLASAAAVTAFAALTDLKLVPDRLTPGFENRLPPRSVALVYVAFACGLALAAAASRRD